MKTSSIAGGIVCRTTGEGPPLVLLHGGAGSWNHWTRNIPALATRFTVYAFDLPGCGDSADVPGGIEPQQYVARVYEGISDVARGASVNLAGFSFGGVCAGMIAAAMPSAVRRLALLAPGGLGRVNNAGARLRKMPPSGAPEAERMKTLRHNLLLMMLAHERSVDDETLALQQHNVVRARYDSRRFTGSTLTREHLWRVRIPTLAIFGALDNLSYPSVYARIVPLRCTKPDVEIELIPDTGHWVQYEAAQAVNRSLIEFLERS